MRTPVPVAKPTPVMATQNSNQNPPGRNSRADFLSNPFRSNSDEPDPMSRFLIPNRGEYRGTYQIPTQAPTISPRGIVSSPLTPSRNQPFNYETPRNDQSTVPTPIDYAAYTPPQSFGPGSSGETNPNTFRPGSFDPTRYSVPQNFVPIEYYQSGPVYSPNPIVAARGDIYAQANGSIFCFRSFYLISQFLRCSGIRSFARSTSRKL